MITRRQAIKAGALAAACAVLPPALTGQTNAPAKAAVPFTVPPLPYPVDALEPYIDARTMEIHHDRHHAAYVAALNHALAPFPELQSIPVAELLMDLGALPDKIRTAVRNNGGGHYNHSLFWQCLKPGGGGEPQGALLAAINKRYGNFHGFRENWLNTALGRFGSGWIWLALESHKLLIIETTANQDCLFSRKHTPLLCMDVWEHAYYLKYQDRRIDYVEAFFNVINWDFVSENYAKAMA